MNGAVLGFGTVGKNVVKILDETEGDCCITAIFARQKYQMLIGDRLQTDIDAIINDSNIDFIVETLGGEEFAYECIKKALIHKKHVVTANKNVVCRYFDELTTLAKTNGVGFHFEASVSGAIPVIHTLIKLITANQIVKIEGIVNGTTNYVLTQMIENQLSLKQAIGQAQQLGFAEQDPSADLEGWDASRKLAILASIAFKQEISLKDIDVKGIDGINQAIIADIKQRGYTVKHMITAQNINHKLQLRSEPVLITKQHPFYQINNETNSIIIHTNNSGTITLSGLGAGGLPTASAVVQDCFLLQQHQFYYRQIKQTTPLIVDNHGDDLFYVSNGKQTTIQKINSETNNNAVFLARVVG